VKKDQGTSDCIDSGFGDGIANGNDTKGGIAAREQTGRFSKGSTDC
jgi:hypothetical protein